MTEDSLKHLSLDDLFALMVKTKDEYSGIEKKPENKAKLESKRSELDVIQKVLTRKRADFPPLK